MKFTAVLRVAAAALATGALLVPGIAPAQADPTYPPKVSALYASPFLVDGYASVTVVGTDLADGLTVKATRGTRSKVATLYVDSSGTFGTAMIKLSTYLVPSTAGRYGVDFALQGASVSGVVTTSQTYTVGKASTITSLKVEGKSYGLYISGKAPKYTPVKLTIKFVGKTYSKSYYKTVKSSSTGRFYYRFYKTTKGTYTVSAQISANTKYFSDVVTASTYTRS